MVNTKKENIRQEAGVRNAMGYGEVRVQFEQTWSKASRYYLRGKAFQAAEKEGQKP